MPLAQVAAGGCQQGIEFAVLHVIGGHQCVGYRVPKKLGQGRFARETAAPGKSLRSWLGWTRVFHDGNSHLKRTRR